MEPGVDGARKQIAEVVAERIERLILDGVLKAGQALPSERRLTEKLGVSRTALREGLRVLRARQIIHTAQGKGSYVAQISQVDAGPLVHLFNSQPRTLYDLLEVRALLESESARLAAIRGTDADFIMIRRRYDEMLAAHGRETDSATHAHLDHAFHLAICQASHNAVLVHTLQSLTDLLLGSVFACVNNLYHREPHKRHIDQQARAPVPCRAGARARAGSPGRPRPCGQRAPEPGRDRTGRAAPGARDVAPGGLGLGVDSQ